MLIRSLDEHAHMRVLPHTSIHKRLNELPRQPVVAKAPTALPPYQ